MNKELIDTATKHGFNSVITPTKENYHLWMADLQKWLRETKRIQSDVIILGKGNGLCYFYVSLISMVAGFDEEYERTDYIHGDPYRTNYEDALEYGLIGVFKLFKL